MITQFLLLLPWIQPSIWIQYNLSLEILHLDMKETEAGKQNDLTRHFARNLHEIRENTAKTGTQFAPWKMMVERLLPEKTHPQATQKARLRKIFGTGWWLVFVISITFLGQPSTNHYEFLGGDYPPWNRHNSWKPAFPKRKVVSHFRQFCHGFLLLDLGNYTYLVTDDVRITTKPERNLHPYFINGWRRLTGDAQRRTARDGGRTASLLLRVFFLFQWENMLLAIDKKIEIHDIWWKCNVFFFFLFLKLFKLSKTRVSTAIDKLMKGEEYQASTSLASPFETLWEAIRASTNGVKSI